MIVSSPISKVFSEGTPFVSYQMRVVVYGGAPFVSLTGSDWLDQKFLARFEFCFSF